MGGSKTTIHNTVLTALQAIANHLPHPITIAVRLRCLVPQSAFVGPDMARKPVS